MKKILILLALAIFMLYTLVGLFTKIPVMFNNIFYGIVTVFAVYFGIFYTDIGQGIKSKLSENSNKYNSNKDKK